MKPGPRRGTVQQGQRSNAEKVADAWGEVPDWVAELAAHADQHTAKATAAAIGYSSSAVSMVLNKGSSFDKLDLDRIEQAVRGSLLGETIACPRKGEMTRDVCLDWQSKPKGSTSPDRVKMYRACRSGCPHSRIKGASNGTE